MDPPFQLLAASIDHGQIVVGQLLQQTDVLQSID
jgi:hypothetical protein